MQGHVLTVVLTVGLAVGHIVVRTREEGGERLEDPVAGKSHRLLSNMHILCQSFSISLFLAFIFSTLLENVPEVAGAS